MAVEYRDQYFNDPASQKAFEIYALTVFNLDFSLWQNHGLWDQAYIPFSAFDGDRCVATICIYPSEMSIQGMIKTGGQLLTVGTLPQYRRRGIQTQLWQRVRAWAEEQCDFVFLFTDESASAFYNALGFKRLPEYSALVPTPAQSGRIQADCRKLNLSDSDDFALLRRLAETREMVSARLGFHTPKLLLFMFLYCYTDCSCYIESIDAVIAAENVNDRLQIHDIVSARMPRFSEIESFLAQSKTKEIEFLFCTDCLEPPSVKHKRLPESVLFVDEGFDLSGKFMFPGSIRA